MLLHSGYANHPYSRFDIVVADRTLTTFGKETVVRESGEYPQRPLDDPLQVSSRCWNRRRSPNA
ncbi:hypothetical protein ACNKHN_07995 [Shigella flexneri]